MVESRILHQFPFAKNFRKMLPVLKVPNPLLRRRANPVESVDDAVRELADAMRETMRAVGGVGLAAPQVGRSSRVIVAEVGEKRDAPLMLANPKVVAAEGELMWREGCLSLPGVFAPVRRSRKVKVAALNMQGEPVEIDAEEHLAICLQHEIDHLDGVLFIDRLSRLKRSLLMAKYEKLRRKTKAESGGK